MLSHIPHLTYLVSSACFILDHLVSQTASWAVVEVEEDISHSKSVAVFILLNRIKAHIKSHTEKYRSFLYIENWRENRIFS